MPNACTHLETANVAVSERNPRRSSKTLDAAFEQTPLGGLLAKHLRAILREEVTAALQRIRTDEEENSAGLSAARAAKMAHCRPATLLQAMASGALPAHKIGTRWVLSAGNVRSWIEAGRPVVATAKAG